MTGGFGFVEPPLTGTDLIEFEDLPGTDLTLLPVPLLEVELVLDGRADELVVLPEEDRDDDDLEDVDLELDFDFEGALERDVLKICSSLPKFNSSSLPFLNNLTNPAFASIDLTSMEPCLSPTGI
jgi:hypothetical protein